jgi:quinol monooxygenase YgiN
MYSLIAKWTILPGNEDNAIAALKKLAEQVQQQEPGTLIYTIFTPDFKEKSLPTPPAGEVTFIEIYENNDAFMAHINGIAYQDFLTNYGQLFLNDFGGKPFVTFGVIEKQAGFFRDTVS